MKKSVVAYSAASMLLAFLSFGALAEDASANCDAAKEDIAKMQVDLRRRMISRGGRCID